MLLIQVIDSLSLWNPTWIVGPQNCRRSGLMRIYHGEELDRLSSAVLLTETVTEFCFTITSIDDHSGSRERFWSDNGLWKIVDFIPKWPPPGNGESAVPKIFKTWQRKNSPDCFMVQFLVFAEKIGFFSKNLVVFCSS